MSYPSSYEIAHYIPATGRLTLRRPLTPDLLRTNVLAAIDQPAAPDTLRRGSVLVGLYESSLGTEVVYVERSKELPRHGGEVAFPGGHFEEGDHDHWATALREAHEEVGLDPKHVEPIGTLPPIVSRFGTSVIPCVGRLSKDASWHVASDEIAFTFSAPLDWLACNLGIEHDEFEVEGETWRVPVWPCGGHRIWGLTAMITVELLRLGYGIDLPYQWRPRTLGG